MRIAALMLKPRPGWAFPNAAMDAFLFFACILLALPVAVGAFGVRDLLRFRGRAFGLYARSSGLLAVGITAGLVYYGVVVLSFAADGAVAGMARWPLTPLAALLYLQSVGATVAVAFIRAGGQRMASITHPGEA